MITLTREDGIARSGDDGQRGEVDADDGQPEASAPGLHTDDLRATAMQGGLDAKTSKMRLEL